jgi:hypothetical protein
MAGASTLGLEYFVTSGCPHPEEALRFAKPAFMPLRPAEFPLPPHHVKDLCNLQK